VSWLDRVPDRYRLILCDLWGVVHDGVRLYPGAAKRLQRWRDEGRFVCLITNAPRPADAVERHLARLGLPRSCYDAVATSGEAGITALNSLGVPVGLLGTADDRADLERHGVRIAAGDDFADLACTGLQEDRPDPGDYRADLERWVARDVHLHCLNPDRLVVYGGVPQACAGAIADLYAMLGGRVTWYGKPFPAIYRHALALAGNPPKDAVLAIGDGLQTDMLGAAQLGVAAVFVAGGISAGASFPEDFGARHGLGHWRPEAVVASLG
jgi:HAD superfamily hydrolase (TIGR01459 family)